jgi:hypothetical protein
MRMTPLFITIGLLSGGNAMSAGYWIPATDESRVSRMGAWQETSFRYAERAHLATMEDGAALSLSFDGTGLSVRLGQHAVPAYGHPNLGALAVRVDGGPERILHPLAEPREVVLARDLPPGEHTARIEHRPSEQGALARVEAFAVADAPTGEIAFTLTGEHDAYLVDARATLTRDGEPVADRLVRNWLTGGCRLAGLAPGEGYRLELRALGWETAISEAITIEPGRETLLSPIHLTADPSPQHRGFRFPRIGRQVVHRPGESLRARLQAYTAEIVGARIERRVGHATISRPLAVEEDEAAAFYYDREIVATLPADSPPGLYDLCVQLHWPEHDAGSLLRSPRAVMVVDEFPRDPVFAAWAHLDTQGQYQAEYLRNLAAIANLAGTDMVLMACACNPAYIAGALSELQIPYAVNFGNHQFPGFERWFGPQEGVTDYGPDLCILNRSLPWHEDSSAADAMLAARPGARIKVINAFECNAPLELLDRHAVALVHDGHGPGPRVHEIGATPTLRVGKSNSESFRMIRFTGGRVASCTYMGDESAPIPFPRGSTPPLRATIAPPADGAHDEATATIANDLEEPFPNCRLTLVMPAGEYACDGGRIERASASDCGEYTVLTVRADAPAQTETIIQVHPR